MGDIALYGGEEYRILEVIEDPWYEVMRYRYRMEPVYGGMNYGYSDVEVGEDELSDPP